MVEAEAGSHDEPKQHRPIIQLPSICAILQTAASRSPRETAALPALAGGPSADCGPWEATAARRTFLAGIDRTAIGAVLKEV